MSNTKKVSCSDNPCIKQCIPFLCNPRLQCLERKILIFDGKTPSVVFEMKKQVDSFREKLEVREETECVAIHEFFSLRGEFQLKMVQSKFKFHTEVCYTTVFQFRSPVYSFPLPCATSKTDQICTQLVSGENKF